MNLNYFLQVPDFPGHVVWGTDGPVQALESEWKEQEGWLGLHGRDIATRS